MIVKLTREIIGMGFMMTAGAYSMDVAGHLTLENFMIICVIMITGRIIFG